MLYIIDNGSSYDDQTNYFIEVPASLDAFYEIMDKVICSVIPGDGPSLLFRAEVKSVVNGIAQPIEELLTPRSFFEDLADDEENPKLPVWEALRPRGSFPYGVMLLNYLFTKWTNDVEFARLVPLMLDEADKRFGKDWMLTSHTKGCPALTREYILEKFAQLQFLRSDLAPRTL